jgi:hypothetical protein
MQCWDLLYSNISSLARSVLSMTETSAFNTVIYVFSFATVDVLTSRVKTGAGVNHLAIEPETVKFIPDVIVMTDIGRDPIFGVSIFGVGRRQKGGYASQSMQGGKSSKLLGERNSHPQRADDEQNRTGRDPADVFVVGLRPCGERSLVHG